YHNLADITTFYKNLAAQYPSVVKYIPSIGKSVSGKDIFAIEITSSVSPPGGKKNAYFQFNIHAREWISGALGQYFSEQLASGYGSNSRVTNILDNVKVAIVGVVNPDGYAYTWTNDRLWRKNRRGSYGVDLNRNYAFGWGGQGASTNPNDETYRGPSAASEPEVQATQNYFKSLPNKIVGLDAHSYSEYILRPYGYTGSLPPAADQSKYVAVANKMVSTIAASRGKRYQSLSIYSGLYPASGGASDYFYGKTPAGSGGTGAYGLSVELSPSSSNFNGFVLPPSEI
ncbi:peptidase M14, carboxypeptidase A, partial [Ramicandelaber brevisporus]